MLPKVFRVGAPGLVGAMALVFGRANIGAQPVSGEIAYTIPAVELLPSRSADAWSTLPGTPNRYLTTLDGCCFEGAIHIPSGVLITAVELEACDTSPSAQVNVTVNHAVSPGGPTERFLYVETGVPDTPGCATFWAGLIGDPPPVYTPVVANRSDKYWVEVSNSSADGSTSIAAVRIIYLRLVSLPPATPTFNDVPPSDSGFQFIEALVGAGITSGCGSSNFCPDAAMTRRQAAVFFAKALGLYSSDAITP